ncbi:cornifelin-like [Cheilinus undulatus]|uniref:cornifelin-like n=1 Tax=Cheilinus undulatus TaxID=241271 RepID=UPI001BD64136|nr:cornifelin-like [Cheilinus undulatus]
MAVTVQPLTDWNTGLFDCCDDVSTCCYGFWCCPCLACTVSGRFGENRCLPLCDICSPAVVSALGIPLCAPPAALSLRAAIRHRHAIKGTLCKDIATSCFCSWCSWCQMNRELKYRKKNTAVVVNVQPPPVMMAPGNAPPAGFVNQPVVMARY